MTNNIENQTPKILTFAMQKGGAGKTTLSYNFSEYLTQVKHKKVLLVDLDYQGSLSETYGFIQANNSSIGMFTGDEVLIRNIKDNDNLDFIPSCFELEDIPSEFRARGVQNIHFLVVLWLKDHYEDIKKYDFIIFDTHPDTLTVTQNALAPSDYQIAVVEPSLYGFNAIPKTLGSMKSLKEVTVNRFTGESPVTTEVLFVLNKLFSNQKLSKELIDQVNGSDINIYGQFNHHTAWTRSINFDSEPIFKMKDFDTKYINKIISQFEILYNKINE